MNKLITSVIFLSLALILGRELVWPNHQKLKSSEQEIKEKKVEVETKKEYFQHVEKVSEELKNYQAQLAKIDSALPLNPDLEILLHFLQETSSKSGLDLTDIKPPITQQIAKEKELLEIKEIELSFRVVGYYTAFKAFLSALERSARLIEVESISFSSSEKEEPQSFELKIKVYSY